MFQQNTLADLAASYVNSTDRHIFLTGKAGTGKTTFLREIVNKTFKEVVIAAPTGIAAINAGGVTLHSLLHLPFGVFVPENIPLSPGMEHVNTPQTLFREFRFNKSKRQMIRQMELLIIDEVSMLRADLLDCIDLVLRHLRGEKRKPFGGLQILFIGDLLQLPPVIKDSDQEMLAKYYPTPYFFSARALSDNPPIQVELQKVFRQSDDKFIAVLNRLRNDEQKQEDLEMLNTYYEPNVEGEKYEGYIHLTTHNYKADSINSSRLDALPGKSFRYKARVAGDFKEQLYPTNEELILKRDAQVMFIKNDQTGERRYFNGKIGKVVDLDADGIQVRFEDGSEVLVEQHIWENKRYTLSKESQEIEEKFLGSFTQYPLKLAWAVTVHKSQGLTFEKAILDLSGSFAPGQLYVALSRLTSLDGLVLSSRLPENPPGIDVELGEYVSKSSSEQQLTEMLTDDRKESTIRLFENAFRFDSLLRYLYYHKQGFDKDENRSIKQQSLAWTNELTDNIRKLDQVGEKFIAQLKQLAVEPDCFAKWNPRTEKAWGYFKNEFDALLERIGEHRKELQKSKRASTYVKELKELEQLLFAQLSKMHKLTMFVSCEAENRTLTKAELRKSGLLLPPPKPQKEAKTPTTEISYEMYKQGLSIEEIAKKREFVVSTIQGHLCNYVKSGDVKIGDLVETGKVDKIMARYEKGIEGLGELKSDLGDDISYGEIKLVLAHKEKDTAASGQVTK